MRSHRSRMGLGVVLFVFVTIGCGDDVTSAPATPSVAPVPVASAPSTAATREAAAGALSWLEDQVRVPAGNPKSPWALAHGLLSFGKDFKAQDGRGAIEVIASFAERVDSGEHYGFPPQRDGQPVEPHGHMLVKTFLEIGVDPTRPLTASDGVTLDLKRLLADMRARVHVPANETEWRHVAWWLTALELDPAADRDQLATLRAAALRQLETDTAVISLDGPNALSPEAPMGRAKRDKTHIYGHPCGGLHFTQAVLRGALNNTAPDHLDRLVRQVRLLLSRYEAERTLYAQVLRAQPNAALPVSVQQLKFFGHVLETLALAHEVGLLQHDAALAVKVSDARKQVTADLLTVITQLRTLNAYGRLAEITAQQPQLALDLVGDGCHAVHGLRDTLPVLPAR